jgi:hypothetical protein
MRLLRATPLILLFGCAAGGVLVIVSASLADTGSQDARHALWWAGVGLLGACGVLFVAFPWAALYVQVMESSRGLPLPQPIDPPPLTPAAGIPVADLAELQIGPNGLVGLGFDLVGWFYLDNFAGLRIAAWRHCSHPAVAFVLFQPGGAPRLRIVRRFGDGAILMTSNRLTDLAVGPPASTYVQVRKTRSAAELWSWHLEAEALFAEQATALRPGDERITRSPGDFAPGRGGAPRLWVDGRTGGGSEAMELFMEIVVRFAWLKRSRARWLLGVNPLGECWRMYWLCGLSLKQQIEDGWTVAPEVRRLVCLPEERE